MNLLNACVLSSLLLSASAIRADQNDPRLEDLFTRLQDANSLAESGPVEELIWQVWSEHADSGANTLMLTGIQQMSTNALPAALNTFNRLIADQPDFAEAWNKRATTYFLMGNYEASEADIVKTLQLEPFHFGALSGRGLVLLSQGKYEEARNAFSRALEVHPNMPSVRNNIDEINRYLRGSTI